MGIGWAANHAKTKQKPTAAEWASRILRAKKQAPQDLVIHPEQRPPTARCPAARRASLRRPCDLRGEPPLARRCFLRGGGPTPPRRCEPEPSALLTTHACIPHGFLNLCAAATMSVQEQKQLV